MKVLVVTSRYPSEQGNYSGVFYHTRNIEYLKQGIDVDVLSFEASYSYQIDDIQVYSYKNYLKSNNQYDILICHAPDRNVYNFLKKYVDNFNKIVFFFHGNEILWTHKCFKDCVRYDFQKQTITKNDFVIRIRDYIKISTWKKFFIKYRSKSNFIFVSNWMYDEFIESTKIDENLIKDKSDVIYNCVGSIFENAVYNTDSIKEYDFITIRGNLDAKKYGIDIVNNLAKNNPKFSFLVIGKGEFFEHNEKANNLTHLEEFCSHEQVLNYLNKSRCALMPTRADSQGVMTCEMAAIGMPTITSNIKVCNEIFEGVHNVKLIDNNNYLLDLGEIIGQLESVKRIEKNNKYFKENTCQKEIQLLTELMGCTNE